MIGVRMTLGAMALGAALAGAVLHPPSAYAVTTAREAYLDQLRTNGAQVLNEDLAVKTGYSICEVLPDINGETLARQYVAAGTFDLPTARVVIVAAAQNLCPDQWHPSSSSPQPQRPSPPRGPVGGGVGGADRQVGGAVGGPFKV